MFIYFYDKKNIELCNHKIFILKNLYLIYLHFNKIIHFFDYPNKLILSCLILIFIG